MKIDTLIQIYVEVDDFFIKFKSELEQIKLFDGKKSIRNRKSKLSESEMMTIYIAFHLSHYTNFKSFYNEYVCVHWLEYFPDLVSYERFNQTQFKLIIPMILFLNQRCLGHSRGVNFIDSTAIKVCHIKREKQHKVFDGIASKGNGTMGWFFGFKLHLIINDKGEILSFYLSKANTDDRNINVINSLVSKVFGKIFGDRGYISKTLADYLWNDGISLIYKRKKNMKKQNLSDEDRLFLRKRSLIESVNDELKNICSIEHTRHRSLQGFINNLISGLCAYHFLPKKPSLKFEDSNDMQSQHEQLLLSVA
jgi:hypothetical protein